MREHILLYVNGQPVRVSGADAFLSLSDFLRRRMRLTGTKVVCAEGDCGSCSILLGRLGGDGGIRYAAVTSCIQTVFQLDATHVVTVEGLRDGAELNPIQQSLVKCQGTQCGFCTPGFVVAMYDLMHEGKPCDAERTQRGLVGNLCRCTGYDSILRAAAETDRAAMRPIHALYPPQAIAEALRRAAEEEVLIEAPPDGRRFYKPVTVEAAVRFREANHGAATVAGGTDLGVLQNKLIRPYKIAMSTAGLAELRTAAVDGEAITIGAGVSLAEFEQITLEHLPELGRFLDSFGSPLIRNAGTLAGNVVTGSPIGDTIPALIVLDAEVELAGVQGRRRVPLSAFYTGYRTTVLTPDEIVTAVRVPLLKRDEALKLDKVARRRDLDISTFGAAFLLRLTGERVDEVRIAYGGVGPMVMRMTRTEAVLRGQPLTLDAIERAAETAREEVAPISDVRGSAAYRRSLAGNVLRKLWHEMRGRAMSDASGNGQPKRPLDGETTTTSAAAPRDAAALRAIGKDIPHDSAVTHVTGGSTFLDDMAPLQGELVAGIVTSPFSHGRLKRLDVSAALKVPGVAVVLTHRDVPGHNEFGPVVKDEVLLVEDEAVFIGQPLAVIGAVSREALEEARRAVVVEMEELRPIFTIDEAIAAESYFGAPRRMERGDVAAEFDAAADVIEGSLDIGGQEHFYLESQIAIAVPGEQGQMTVHSSTQHPSEVQMMVAEVLGRPFNHVTCVCKRMGGGFGGKETQAAQPAMLAALVAAKTGRPARFAYTKDDDMRYTGKRHPFKCVYKAGFTRDGRVTALDVQLYSNGGCSTDLSFAVLERAMLHTDNAYFLPNVRIVARVCRTNLPSNTAFRGFGGPQGVAGIENILQEIATRLGLDALDVRQANCYGVEDRNVTPYGQTVRNNKLPELFAALRRECDYDARRADIRRFNASSQTHLRGLAVSAVKFGISFTRKTMNQANALVNIYQDGSVIVSTGATEMGQGVNTRIRQVVADELGVPYADVIVAPTSTDKNNNTSPTAASSGTDLNGAAAADACSRLRARLADVAASMLSRAGDGAAPEASHITFEAGRVFDPRDPQRPLRFRDVVCEAFERRVSLGERGFYATPGVDFNRDTGQGTPFLYFTNGVACSEVLIDHFTGEFTVPRVDLIMDAGVPLNPGIDRGQIVGGFIQGMGWVTMEELVYGPKGNLLSNSPTTYKVPGVSDVPPIFNVRFLDNPHNDVSLYRSKAVGEPPLLLGLSVWLAVKDALADAAGGKLLPGMPRLPATAETVLMALEAMKPKTKMAVR